MAHDVFISHSHQDKPVADAVCAGLESAGIRCWIAPRDILPGNEWGASIIDAISGCRVMIVIFSAHANASKQVLREVERCVSREITIVPLRVDNVMPSGSMEYFLGTPHWLDAMTPPLERHIARLVDIMRAILARLPRVDEQTIVHARKSETESTPGPSPERARDAHAGAASEIALPANAIVDATVEVKAELALAASSSEDARAAPSGTGPDVRGDDRGSMRVSTVDAPMSEASRNEQFDGSQPILQPITNSGSPLIATERSRSRRAPGEAATGEQQHLVRRAWDASETKSAWRELVELVRAASRNVFFAEGASVGERSPRRWAAFGVGAVAVLVAVISLIWWNRSGSSNQGSGNGSNSGVADSAVASTPPDRWTGVPEAGKLYYEYQVERPVMAAAGSQSPAYPNHLRSAGVEGEVFASFVVDTNGRAELSTFHVLKTTNNLFAVAVSTALPGMRFQPAAIGGKKVRQLVQQPFVFHLEGTSAQSGLDGRASSAVAIPTTNRGAGKTSVAMSENQRQSRRNEVVRTATCAHLLDGAPESDDVALIVGGQAGTIAAQCTALRRLRGQSPSDSAKIRGTVRLLDSLLYLPLTPRPGAKR